MLYTLRGAGYGAYFVGGCVRDSLLGRRVHDWDAATSAPPQAVQALFERTAPTGLRHGTVTVISGGRALEVTTFRTEGAYSDHRRPDSVRFTGDLDHTVHCRNNELEACAEACAAYIRGHFHRPRITLVGYQPALTARLSQEFSLRVLDMNPQFVDSVRSGVTIEHGKKSYQDAVLEWPDLVLCTGSTLCNGSFVDFVDIGRPVLFFGISGAAAARIFGIPRFCPMAG